MVIKDPVTTGGNSHLSKQAGNQKDKDSGTDDGTIHVGNAQFTANRFQRGN
jgi:hypothetical protein